MRDSSSDTQSLKHNVFSASTKSLPSAAQHRGRLERGFSLDAIGDPAIPAGAAFARLACNGFYSPLLWGACSWLLTSALLWS